MKIKYLFIICTLVFIITCKKDRAPIIPTPCSTCLSCSSDTKPKIAYDSYQKYGNDSLVINIKFCDKDGDIGLAAGDTAGIFKNGNLVATYYYKDSLGSWLTWDADQSTTQMDTLKIFYRIPLMPTSPITSSVTIGGFPTLVKVILQPSQILEGKIQILQKPFFSPFHEIRYIIFMYDKAQHKSNMITTASIYY
ncbi:MAG: hypothetical protein HY063_09985 [Bacteroidetes bacterium]|nr:hypothetical protein [Bacteroidota bacterium]